MPDSARSQVSTTRYVPAWTAEHTRTLTWSGSGREAGLSPATSRLDGARFLLTGLLLPSLLFSTEQPGWLLRNKSDATFPLNSKASQPSYFTYRTSHALAKNTQILATQRWSGDQQWRGLPRCVWRTQTPCLPQTSWIRVCTWTKASGSQHIHWSLRSSASMVWPAVGSLLCPPLALL